MPAKKYHVKLSSSQRDELIQLTKSGNLSARQLRRIYILLLSDETQAHADRTDQEIIKLLEVSAATVSRVRQRFVEGGLAEALQEQVRSGRPTKFSGQQRAGITALACSTPPEGYGTWSLRLLANKAVELELVPEISHDSVREILKKTNSSPT